VLGQRTKLVKVSQLAHAFCSIHGVSPRPIPLTDMHCHCVAHVTFVLTVCTGSPTLGNGTFSCGANSLVGRVCNGTCNTGYIGTPRVVCQDDSSWSNVDGSCQRGGIQGKLPMCILPISCLIQKAQAGRNDAIITAWSTCGSVLCHFPRSLRPIFWYLLRCVLQHVYPMSLVGSLRGVQASSDPCNSNSSSFMVMTHAMD
jgi:hypothetical protein